MAATRTKQKAPPTTPAGIAKSPTGISGLDEITEGGLPAGRPTLVCGAAGCGKTMLAAEFLVRGATEYDEPGVFMMFEESADELAENMRSLGFDLEKLQRQKKLALDFVRVERSEIEETGEYDLEGLFIRLGYAIDSIGAKRVVLDTVEALFAGVPNHAILRSELRRLFRWLKDKGVTAIITAERGDSAFTRYGLEEYVADCVILLDHRIAEQVSTRRLRVVKYRGSAHGTNEYPFLIGRTGLSVLPITSLALNHQASRERVSTGIAGLDDMLGGRGVYRGSSLLVSGAPGTGKSSIAASFANAACARGEKAVLFAYEESESQLLRNMESIGLNLRRWVDKGLLRIESTRPTLQGLEQHLVHMYDLVREFAPSVVVVDPISNLTSQGDDAGLKITLMRLIDFLKTQGTTALFTSLTADAANTPLATSEVGVSSLMDSWLLLANVAVNGERTRTLQVLKSRGMPHSNQVREFVFSDTGVDLVDVYLFGDQVLTGTARIAHEAQLLATNDLRGRDHARRLRDLANRRKTLDAQIAALNAQALERAGEVEFEIEREQLEAQGVQDRARSIAARRGTSGSAASKPAARKG
ncbi:RecA-superfamily ATPase possibly involved in signal transduction [Acidovorax sp. CF316]|uniref:circadian clock protein KaiC n=1 Tax=Acidovorax sp. CF316 TaxID=1144317 RepID=UPI00026BE52A|nr:circadian clock protein KaiC [Acidovorax sp. CF316]EJE50978.1 RecA-superfamily ATPase possibly involved in signal transduction [Acidovorax sp. CF316]